ncbi:hypothetical protein, partial [Amylibacter sp. SFDW26]|uniref:hypothetical protein n=1 Tax=Amylibacter sp. SFDW26 TaxID=2652722 RepID=UPI001D00E25F
FPLARPPLSVSIITVRSLRINVVSVGRGVLVALNQTRNPFFILFNRFMNFFVFFYEFSHPNLKVTDFIHILWITFRDFAPFQTQLRFETAS